MIKIFKKKKKKKKFLVFLPSIKIIRRNNFQKLGTFSCSTSLPPRGESFEFTVGWIGNEEIQFVRAKVGTFFRTVGWQWRRIDAATGVIIVSTASFQPVCISYHSDKQFKERGFSRHPSKNGGIPLRPSRDKIREICSPHFPAIVAPPTPFHL